MQIEYKSEHLTLIYDSEYLAHGIYRNNQLNCKEYDIGYCGYSDEDTTKYSLQYVWDQLTSNELRELADLIDKLPNIK